MPPRSTLSKPQKAYRSSNCVNFNFTTISDPFAVLSSVLHSKAYPAILLSPHTSSGIPPSEPAHCQQASIELRLKPQPPYLDCTSTVLKLEPWQQEPPIKLCSLLYCKEPLLSDVEYIYPHSTFRERHATVYWQQHHCLPHDTQGIDCETVPEKIILSNYTTARQVAASAKGAHHRGVLLAGSLLHSHAQHNTVSVTLVHTSFTPHIKASLFWRGLCQCTPHSQTDTTTHPEATHHTVQVDCSQWPLHCLCHTQLLPANSTKPCFPC